MTEDGVERCPECGHDGAFDSQGSEKEFLRRVRVDQEGIKRGYKVVRIWDGFRCTGCGCHFRTLREETEEQEPGRVIA